MAGGSTPTKAARNMLVALLMTKFMAMGGTIFSQEHSTRATGAAA